MCPQLQSSNAACQWEQGSGWLRHQIAACAAGCRQIDCLALSYLEVLQAAPLAELTVPGIAAAAEAAPATFHSLVDIDAEPQCRRLARLFAVPALQPLLLANGGVDALLAGATRLLVRTGASTLCMPSAAAQQHSNASAFWTATDNRAAALCHDVFVSAPMRLPPLPCVQHVQTVGDDFGGIEYIRANFGSRAVDSLLHACCACPAVARVVGADAALLRLLPRCAAAMQNQLQMMFADVRRVGPASGACNGSLWACLQRLPVRASVQPARGSAQLCDRFPWCVCRGTREIAGS